MSTLEHSDDPHVQVLSPDQATVTKTVRIKLDTYWVLSISALAYGIWPWDVSSSIYPVVLDNP